MTKCQSNTILVLGRTIISVASSFTADFIIAQNQVSSLIKCIKSVNSFEIYTSQEQKTIIASGYVSANQPMLQLIVQVNPDSTKTGWMNRSGYDQRGVIRREHHWPPACLTWHSMALGSEWHQSGLHVTSTDSTLPHPPLVNLINLLNDTGIKMTHRQTEDYKSFVDILHYRHRYWAV